jgi:protein-L-isoaspartate(D-aspartate) O-methyltransferase
MNKKQLLQHLRNSGFSDLVVSAFENVRREDFISGMFLPNAYDDHPLPLGTGSTISQPSTIAFMLDLLELKDNKLSFLEIGSGCGYVLALVYDIIKDGKIYGLEINGEIAEASVKRFKDNSNVTIFCRDGKNGSLDNAPFDRILISAACAQNPYHLLEQLNNNGIIVAAVQNSIVKVIKKDDKAVVKEHFGFRFVPLI